MVNRVFLVGNLGHDPELRYTPQGTAVCSFSLATKEKRGENEKTQWHQIVAFGKTAENANQYLNKGRQAFIEGRIDYQEWEKDGVKKKATKIIAERITFLGDRAGAPRQSTDSSSAGGASEREPGADDDIPF